MSDSDSPLVYIVDTDASLRAALCQLMHSVGLSACGFRNLACFLTLYQPRRPSCLLLEWSVLGESGSLQDQVRVHSVDAPVIIMAHRSSVATAVTAMKQGALDFLEKPLNEQMLLDVVHQALADDRRFRRERAWRQTLLDRWATLTPREREILHQVAVGLSNRDIAERLALSPKTVEVHRAKVMQKMGARTLSHLVRMAMAMGMVTVYDRDSFPPSNGKKQS